jgi:hypothetical protein
MSGRSIKELAKVVEERCAWSKLTSSDGLIDFDPLVVVMCLVDRKCKEEGLKNGQAREVWFAVMTRLQANEYRLEHNRFIPCRYCDQAFEPVIDDKLLTLFLKWDGSRDVKDLLAIHRCPACGGQLVAKRTKKYEGDMHTPEPGSISMEYDEDWAGILLEYFRM